MVGEIVARRHAAEHAAHPARRLLLVARALRRRAPHARADRMASSTSVGSTPDTTVTSPIRTGSTKCTLPWTVFLSCTRRASRLSGGDAVERRDRAVAVHQLQDVDAVLGGKMAGALRQVDGGAHAQSHRLAVQEARVAGLRFERVAEGVAEVQDAAQVAFALVGRTPLRPSCAPIRR